MCGLWGFSSTNKKNWDPLNRFKFELLGIQMDSRGGDGCGIAYDGFVLKSEEIKKFDDLFRINDLMPISLKYPAIIGHDRKASVGEKSYENTQPIFFTEKGNAEDEISSILAHNGTLYNHQELYDKHKAEIHYGLDTSKMSDSQMLALLIEKVGWSILNEYIGTAAILYMNANENGVIYAYHGKSPTRKDFAETEERPLYYCIDQDNIWFCSTKTALRVIVKDEKLIEELPFNKVFKIIGNSMTEVFDVNRSNSFQIETIVKEYPKSFPTRSEYSIPGYKYGYNYGYNYGYGYDDDIYDETLSTRNKSNNNTNQLKLAYNTVETPLFNDVKPTYYPVNTCYWDRGLYYSDAKLLHGMVAMNKSGVIQHNKDRIKSENYCFYFWNGNLINKRTDFIKATYYYEDYVNTISPKQMLIDISQYFAFPYKIPSEIGGDDNILYEGGSKVTNSKFNGHIHPLFTTKKLTFRDGTLIDLLLNNSYEKLNNVINLSDTWPEEFIEWEKSHLIEMKDIQNEMIKSSKINKESYECPECMGNGGGIEDVCEMCNGDGIVANDIIIDAMKYIVGMQDDVTILAESAKIAIAINNIADMGISILEEPNASVLGSEMLSKLYTIKECLAND